MRALTIGSGMVDVIVLVEGRDIERIATHNAAAVASQVDTQSGLLDRTTLEQRSTPATVEPRHWHLPRND